MQVKGIFAGLKYFCYWADLMGRTDNLGICDDDAKIMARQLWKWASLVRMAFRALKDALQPLMESKAGVLVLTP